MRALKLLVVVMTFMSMSVGAARAAEAQRYVALGDSYSSGVGAGEYFDGGCDQSPNAYSQLWATAHRPTSYTSVACGGATVSSVAATQLKALSASTTLVSMTVGGNDVGFGSVMTTCTIDSTSLCMAAINAAENKARTILPGTLDSLYSAIRSKAPQAEVVILSYPHFFHPANSCNFMLTSVRNKLNEAVDVIDGVTANVVADHQFVFADARTSFSGHELCTNSNWLKGLNFSDLGQSYHPTAAGQANGYLPAFTAAVA